MKKVLIIISCIIIISLFYFLPTEKTGTVVEIKEPGEIAVYFCPQDDCENVLVDFIDSAKESIHCALFDVGLESVQNKLLEKAEQIEVQVVTDNDYLHKFNYDFVKADSWGLMHNKFCIIDNQKISTGSMNPTNNGAYKNNNNLLLIESKSIAENYENEFQELWSGQFKGGDRIIEPKVYFGNVTIETYFCPEDSCAYRVKEELKKAEKSIHLMTFSFTHEGIANILLLKHLDGISVQGVMEARQVTKYSQYERLLYNGIDVIKDGNLQNMHHKVFIIDETTVITGSFNPTNGGDSRNDENILIIHNEEIATSFLAEFVRIRELKNP